MITLIKLFSKLRWLHINLFLHSCNQSEKKINTVIRKGQLLYIHPLISKSQSRFYQHLYYNDKLITITNSWGDHVILYCNNFIMLSPPQM